MSKIEGSVLNKFQSDNERSSYEATASYYAPPKFAAGMLTGQMILDEVRDGNIEISNFDPSRINPNSYNLTLNDTLLVYKESETLDFKKSNPTNKIIIPEKGLTLYPGILYIGRTNEVCYTDKYIPMINGRSSIGRLGINVHITAGFGDIGWRGSWTLEISVIRPVKIYPNIEFCQVCYFTPYGDTGIQYDGRYQNQIDPTPSKSNLEKKVYL